MKKVLKNGTSTTTLIRVIRGVALGVVSLAIASIFPFSISTLLAIGASGAAVGALMPTDEVTPSP